VSKSNHPEAQIIGALKQMEAGRSAAEIEREYGVSKHTVYAWKAKYGGDGCERGSGGETTPGRE
jgi:putative transposase